MEGQSAKRRRVYSLEPNKVVQATFTRNYMNYLVPALMKIKEKNSTEHNCDFQSVVKYEVDKAMVFSAQGFAWSNALKVKLQRDGVNVNSGSTGFVENKAGEGSSKVCDQNEMVLPMDFFSSKSEAKNLMCKSKHNGDDMSQMGKDLTGENDDEDEDEVINGQLRSLRRLIPGGEEMCHEQMVTELESYVSCLQMQADILQCLAESETS